MIGVLALPTCTKVAEISGFRHVRHTEKLVELPADFVRSKRAAHIVKGVTLLRHTDDCNPDVVKVRQTLLHSMDMQAAADPVLVGGTGEKFKIV